MKLFGSSKSSKHAGSAAGAHSDPPKKAGRSKAEKAITAVLATLVSVALLMLVLVVIVKRQIKPPPVVDVPNNPNQSEATGDKVPGSDDPSAPVGSDPTDIAPSDGPTEDPGPQVETDPPANYTRRKGVYTFLAMGRDKLSGSTDTLMLACFDTNDYSLNIVSIPRDILVNVSWPVKKINTLYNYHQANDAFLQDFANVLGFRPDFYGLINLNAFIKLVDSIGGVDYYVPQNMNYEDPEQGLYIHFTKGMQHLNGQKAMEYMRFRSGYDDQDIGRIHAQQSFLLTAAQQILEKKDSIPVTTIIDIFMNDVKTSLDIGECGWFAKELLKLDFENIHFYTMPGNYNDYAFGGSYAVVDFEAWLEMVNEYVNPFEEDLTIANFDMVTRDGNGVLYATSGVLKVYG